MTPEQFRKNRVMFYLDSCPHCRGILEFISKINLKLPIEKRIKLVECGIYQRNGIVTDPLQLLYNEKFNGFPTIFIGNIQLNGSNSRFESEATINALLEEDFVIPEYSSKKFNKDCSFNKKGLFKGKILCK